MDFLPERIIGTLLYSAGQGQRETQTRGLSIAIARKTKVISKQNIEIVYRFSIAIVKVPMSRLSCQKVWGDVSVYLIVFIACYISYSTGANETVCNINCSECSQDGCTECKIGHWGSMCEEECFNCWNDSNCNNDSGRCDTCSPGYYADNCNKTCSRNCRPAGSDNITHCYRDTGECMRCEFGVSGQFCTDASRDDKLVTDSELDTNTFVHFPPEQEQTSLGLLAYTLVLILPPFLIVCLVGVLPKYVQCLCRRIRDYYSQRAGLTKNYRL